MTSHWHVEKMHAELNLNAENFVTLNKKELDMSRPHNNSTWENQLMKSIRQGSKLSLSQRNMRAECHLSKLNTQKGNSHKES